MVYREISQSSLLVRYKFCLWQNLGGQVAPLVKRIFLSLVCGRESPVKYLKFNGVKESLLEIGKRKF